MGVLTISIPVEAIAVVISMSIFLFVVWAAVATIWVERPPVTYDERTRRYRSARPIKQRKGHR